MNDRIAIGSQFGLSLSDPDDCKYSGRIVFLPREELLHKPAQWFLIVAPRRKNLRSEYSQDLRAREAVRRSVVLLRSEPQTLHKCVYIADDIAFTNNGARTRSSVDLIKLFRDVRKI
jgi:hypothetical protein